MAETVTNYGRFTESLLEGRVNLFSDELWCMLVTSAYVFSQHAHKYKSIVTGEITGSGYSPGGQKIGHESPIYDSPTKTVHVPCGNLAWPSVTFTGAVGAVIYVKRDGVPSNAMPLVSYINFGEVVNRNDQAFYMNFPTTGVLKLAVP